MYGTVSLFSVLRLVVLTFFLVQVSPHSLYGQEGRKIRLGFPAVSFSSLVHLVAKEAGIFRKHGLNVELIQISGPVLVTALIVGEVDYSAAINPGILLAAKGLPLTVVMATTKAPLFYVISQAEVKDLRGLVGKKLAVSRIGSLSHLLTRLMIQKGGIDPDQVTYIQTGSTSNSLAALGGRAVDAAALSMPFNVVMTKKGFNQLVSTQGIGIYPNTGLQASKEKMENNREEVKVVIEALLDTMGYIGKEKGMVIDYIKRTWKLSADVAEQTYKEFIPFLPRDGKISLEAVQEYLNGAFKDNQLPRHVDVKTVVDLSALEQVLKRK